MKSIFSIIIINLCLVNSIMSQNWVGGGNNAVPPQAITTANNFLGTTNTNNIPIRLGTFGIQRMFFSPNVTGRASTIGVGTSFNAGNLPMATMHLQSDDGNWVGGGYRTWMTPSTGTTNQNPGLLIGNADNIWLGLRNKGGYDLNDAILNWGDNSGTAAQGADFFRFTFTHWDVNNQPGGTTNGLEIMRFAPNSNVGIGDFQITSIFNPQSKLHIHEDYSEHPGGGTGQSVWMQMTNTDFAPNPTANNGLRIGLLYQNANQRTGNAFIYNQENRHLIFSTNHATPNGNGAINNTLERMRITSAGAPTTLVGGYGVFNPNGVAPQNLDFTRVAISLNPNNPIQRPLSLLHLGFQASGAGANLDGWRNWMENGTFTNSDFGFSMYSGLKTTSADAILSWGYTPSPSAFVGSRMRILFTTPTTGTLTAAGANGIEAAHFWSDGNNTRMGVGDMQTAGVDPQNTLEIRSSAASPYWATGNASGLRFTNLISTDAVVLPTAANGINKTKWLTVDINGDVVLSSLTQIGNICGATPTNPLANSWEVIMQNKNYIFKDNELGSVGIGAFGADCTPENTLEIVANANSPYPLNSSSGLRLTRLTSASSIVPNGTSGVNSNKLLTVDENGDVVLTSLNAPVGVLGNNCSNTDNPLMDDYEIPLNNHRFVFSGFGTVNIGPNVSCANPNIASLYVRNSLAPTPTAAILAHYAPNSGLIGSAIRGEASTNLGYAGFFAGDTWTTGTMFANLGTWMSSDKRIKEEIVTIKSSLDIISKLNPVSFKYNTTYAPQLINDERKHFGFIAQEIEELVPELIKETTLLPSIDSLGNITDSSVTIKTLNYDGLIPFAIGGIQELNQKQQEILKSLEKLGLSDALVKNNVSSFNALSKIKQLSPVSYNFTNANVPQLSFGNATDYGFVAQQLETVYPELIDTVRIAETLDSLGNIQNPSVVLKTVNYKAMSALLTRAVQEQQLTIDSLKQAQSAQDSINNSVQNQLAQLTALINSCCQNTSSRTNTTANSVIDVELSDKDIIVLNQNVPNPFAEQTTIAYNIPEKSGFAQIIFNDMKGQIIKVVDIKAKGKGQLNVFANDLSTGMYTYSLYVDGKLIDTKKMVKTE